VFPRRLFSASRWYVNAAAGIRTPADLVGRRVGLSSYQTTLSVLAKGDLEREYGVPWREIIWVAATEEPMPFDLPASARLERVPPGARLDALLLDGTLQAVAHPQPPPAIQGGDPRVRRLFADAPAEERAYYQRSCGRRCTSPKQTIYASILGRRSVHGRLRPGPRDRYRYHDDLTGRAWPGVATTSRTSCAVRRRSLARRPGGQPPYLGASRIRPARAH
jgi:hypothetical protein